MPSLLFERDVELIVSDLSDKGTMFIRHRNHADDATNIDESTELNYEEIKKLEDWLRDQRYAYELMQKDKKAAP